jgi:hypothetical protein
MDRGLRQVANLEVSLSRELASLLNGAPARVRHDGADTLGPSAAGAR